MDKYLQRRFIGPVLSFLFAGNLVFATDNLRLPDTRSMATGGNGVTQTSLFNPSLVALQDSRQVRFDYYNRYNLKELGTLTGSFSYPNPILPVAVHLASFGYDAYRETMLRLSVGKQLNKHWMLGMAVHYTALQTELFDERPACLCTDIGVLFSPTGELRIGMSVINAPSVSVGDKSTGMESIAGYAVQAGFQWEIMEKLLLLASVETNRLCPLAGSMGVAYTVFDNFHFRSGIRTAPLSPSLGVGYDFLFFSLDTVAVWHPLLGVSTGAGFSFRF
jgi:hypothetical protein